VYLVGWHLPFATQHRVLYQRLCHAETAPSLVKTLARKGVTLTAVLLCGPTPPRLALLGHKHGQDSSSHAQPPSQLGG
jgi:hypothetical protein